MAKKKTSITIADTLLYQASTMAEYQKRTRNEIIQDALDTYFKLVGMQMWEKQVSDSEYQMVSIYDNKMCLDTITKRAVIDTIPDITLLMENGYYPIFEV